MMAEPIINKVAESGLITLDLSAFLPRGESAVFDLKDHLFMGMILKEKEFREALKNLDWEPYRDRNVALTCSVDAIIPVWAWMLAASYLQPVARELVMGNPDEMYNRLFLKNIDTLNMEEYAGQRVVVKGCGDTPIPDFIYMEITKRLRPVAKSIMYGEPCSTVPVFKKK